MLKNRLKKNKGQVVNFFWEDRTNAFASLGDLVASGSIGKYDIKKVGHQLSCSLPKELLRILDLELPFFLFIIFSRSLIIVFQISNTGFQSLLPKCFAPIWTLLNWNSKLVFIENWFDAKKGTWTKPSKPSLRFRVQVQISGQVIVMRLVKIYSIPKCHLQRAQLSQKKFLFWMSLWFCQIRDSSL